MKKGFTLIELMVVVAIIAILSLVGMAAYGNVQKNARDAKRKGDIHIIRNALEAYYMDHSEYPKISDSDNQSCVVPSGGNLSQCTGENPNWTDMVGGSEYYASGKAPVDPINVGIGGYYYVYTPFLAARFKICAGKLESTGEQYCLYRTQ